MRSLSDVIPDFSDFFGLPSEELGLIILQLLNESSFKLVSQGQILASIYDFRREGYPAKKQMEVQRIIAEAWGWLVTEGLLVQDPTQPSSYFFISRRGHGLATPKDIEVYRRGSRLPHSLFHETIRDKVRSLLLRGDYDTAVFQAFKEVEVAVRQAAGLPTTKIGRDLMNDAFKPNAGPLVNKSRPEAEQLAERELFAGAIGSYKNPQSHRHVGIPTAEEAAEMIILASHLLRIVEARAAAAAPDGTP